MVFPWMVQLYSKAHSCAAFPELHRTHPIHHHKSEWDAFKTMQIQNTKMTLMEFHVGFYFWNWWKNHEFALRVSFTVRNLAWDFITMNFPYKLFQVPSFALNFYGLWFTVTDFRSHYFLAWFPLTIWNLFCIFKKTTSKDHWCIISPAKFFHFTENCVPTLNRKKSSEIIYNEVLINWLNDCICGNID